MDSGDGLSEDRHDHGVRGIDSGKLHIESCLVGRNALEEQLAGIRIFAFVALQWNFEQAYAHQGGKQDYEQDEGPGEKSGGGRRRFGFRGGAWLSRGRGLDFH